MTRRGSSCSCSRTRCCVRSSSSRSARSPRCRACWARSRRRCCRSSIRRSSRTSSWSPSSRARFRSCRRCAAPSTSASPGRVSARSRGWSSWTNHGSAPKPCQAKPKWTVLRNDDSFENVLGYSGTNSKYVKIVESNFYNNGAGIVPNTLDSEGYEPNGWNYFEHNNVFWNNYNYFLAGSSFKTVSAGLGELSGLTINYPTGSGFLLYGGANNVVRQNNVFGNFKWGIASFSGPGEAL